MMNDKQTAGKGDTEGVNESMSKIDEIIEGGQEITNFPEIKAIDLEKAKNDAIIKGDAWYFLFAVTDKYLEMLQNDPEIMKNFNVSQHTLFAYNYLYGEVMNGGFIQLIQNGYGSYIFDSPFSEIIHTWGAEKIAEIVDEAKIIYT